MPLIIQQTGLSGVGKSTLANLTAKQLQKKGYKVVVLDGDEFRKTVSNDLGYCKKDRLENIFRMGKAASEAIADVVIISAINPFDEGRAWLKSNYQAHLIWVSCSLKTLIKRDTKDFYRRALLPDGHQDKVYKLTGLGGEFDTPSNPQLIIQTDQASLDDCYKMMENYILNQLLLTNYSNTHQTTYTV